MSYFRRFEGKERTNLNYFLNEEWYWLQQVLLYVIQEGLH